MRIRDIFSQSFVVTIWLGEDEMSGTDLNSWVENSFDEFWPRPPYSLSRQDFYQVLDYITPRAKKLSSRRKGLLFARI